MGGNDFLERADKIDASVVRLLELLDLSRTDEEHQRMIDAIMGATRAADALRAFARDDIEAAQEATASMGRYGKRSRPAFLALRDRVADTMSSLQEGLTGVRVVQSFGREGEHYDAYRARSRAQVSAWRRVSLVNIGFFPVLALAQALALAAVVLFGGYLHRQGEVTTGTVGSMVRASRTSSTRWCRTRSKQLIAMT